MTSNDTRPGAGAGAGAAAGPQPDGAPAAPRWAAALSGLEYKQLVGADGMATLEVAREHLHALLAALKERAGFAMCTLVTAVDHYPKAPRFALTHQLLSLEHNERLRVRCWLREGDEHAPSCADLWPGANWSERECFDMFGIRFDAHPDLRRLLMPQGYDHHPLRKEFPHAGIEPDRLYRQWDKQRRAGWNAEEGAAR